MAKRAAVSLILAALQATLACGDGRQSTSARVEREWQYLEQRTQAAMKRNPAARPQLLDVHRGRFVAVRGGEVIDSDPDEFRLAARIELLPMREGPVAICKVTEAEGEATDYTCAHFESPVVAEPEQ